MLLTNLFVMNSKQLSIFIAGMDCFVSDWARGVLNPVLWPLAKKFGATVTTLGLLVSTFGVGNVVMSAEIGRFADESIHRHKGALLVCSGLVLLGALFWTLVVVGGGLPMLFIAQFLMGLGTGNLGVLRSYVAEQALPEERTWRLAQLSAYQYAGIAATPILGALLFMGGTSMGGGQLPFVMPGCLLVVCTAVIVGVLYRWFENIHEDPAPNCATRPPSLEPQDIEAKGSSTGIIELTETCNPLVPQQVQQQVEGNGQHVSHGAEEQTKASATVSEGLRTSCLSTPQMSHFYSCLPWCTSSAISTNEVDEASSEARDLQEVLTLCIFLNFTTRGVLAVYESVGTALLIDRYHLSEIEAAGLMSFGGIVGTVNLLLFRDLWTKHFDDVTLLVTGLVVILCAQSFVLDLGIGQEPHLLWQYALSHALVYAVGYPIANSAVLGLFAFYNQRERQALRQGQLARMAGVGRIVLPIVATTMNQYLHPLAAFALVSLLMCLSLLAVCVWFHKVWFFRYGKLTSSGTHLSSHAFRHQPWQTWQLLSLAVVLILVVVSGMAAVT